MATYVTKQEMKKHSIKRREPFSALLAAGAWIMFGAASMYASLKSGLELPDWILLIGSGVLASGLWIGSLIKLGWGQLENRASLERAAGPEPAPNDEPPDTRPELSLPCRLLRLALCCGVIVTCGLYISDTAREGLNKYSQNKFDQARLQFTRDPNGFSALQRFAKDSFNLHVVLGSKQQNWANTSLAIPDASAASMIIGPGYCLLGWNQPNILRTFFPGGQIDPQLWLHGVVMHEFGHCVDMSRDLPPYNGDIIQTHSIAPGDVRFVKDFPTYVETEHRDTTEKWREIYADAFAIGYFRLNDVKSAPAFINSLRYMREKHAKEDKIHATMCWINVAASQALPTSNRGLLDWADAVRRISLP
jgi:hypothetical protein